MATKSELIGVAVKRLQAQTPSLAKLRLVIGLNLTSGGITGPQRVESFRIELPGPQVSEGEPDDARVTLAMPRSMFELLATDGELADWREAYQYGHLKIGGDQRVLKLLGRALTASR